MNADAASRDAGAVASLAPLTLACFNFMFGGVRVSTAEAEEAQWAAIAQAIRSNKGACVADQLRPFLLDVRGAGEYRLDGRRAEAAGRAEAGDGAAAAAQASAQAADIGDGDDDAQSRWISLDERMLPVVARFDGRPVATDAVSAMWPFLQDPIAGRWPCWKLMYQRRSLPAESRTFEPHFLRATSSISSRRSCQRLPSTPSTGWCRAPLQS